MVVTAELREDDMAAVEQKAPTTPEVRAWCQKNNIPVSKTGALPAHATAAWNARHPKRKYGPAAVPVK